MRRWLLLLVPALILAACGGGTDTDPPDADGVAGAPVAAQAQDGPSARVPFDVNAVDLRTLIYWDVNTAFEVRQRDVPAEQAALLNELVDAPNDASLPYLVDLASIPNPYLGRVYSRLLGRYGHQETENLHDIPSLFSPSDPADDTAAYLAFKAQLFSTVDPQFAAFLDPSAPRLIAAREVVWGGVVVDGIPPLESPAYISPAQATDWINPDDDVIGVNIDGDARAFPLRIIGWHEMVNDTVGGRPVSLAYCTLCGSAILYDGRVETTVYRFGTSGLLYRSNKLMYDRVTQTLWDQFTGKPVWGTLAGGDVRLSTLPVVQTTWAAWLAANPDTLVLDINTGFRRDYSPGAAYREYFASDDTLFIAPERDDRLGQKDNVVVLRLGDAVTAYPVTVLAEQQVIHDRVGDVPVVVVATPDGSGGRGFESGGRTFRLNPDGRLQDEAGEFWSITEDGLVADGGARLARIPGHNAFWFAIANHTPGARLFEAAS